MSADAKIEAKPENAEYFIGRISAYFPDDALALMRIIDDLKSDFNRVNAESAELCEALLYICSGQTFAGDTALKRSYRDLQQTASEALTSASEGKAFLARLKAAECLIDHAGLEFPCECEPNVGFKCATCGALKDWSQSKKAKLR